MGGEMPKLAPFGGRRVPIEQRVANLEVRMDKVEAGVAVAVTEATGAHTAATEAAQAVKALAADVRDVLSVVKATKTVGGFVQKHYPRLIAFGTGLAAAAGWGNPKVIQFISHFFGI
jgi:hypothetical protein